MTSYCFHISSLVRPDERVLPVTFTANNARQENASGQAGDLGQPKADIVLENGCWVVLIGTEGFYYLDKQTLELTGAVNLFHDKGYEFKTTSAVLDLTAGDAVGTEPVQGQGPFGQQIGRAHV